MKVQFKQSIKELVDSAINSYKGEIEFLQLTKDEYIQFIHEVDTTSKILLSMNERTYRNIPIKIFDVVNVVK